MVHVSQADQTIITAVWLFSIYTRPKSTGVCETTSRNLLACLLARIKSLVDCPSWAYVFCDNKCMNLRFAIINVLLHNSILKHIQYPNTKSKQSSSRNSQYSESEWKCENHRCNHIPIPGTQSNCLRCRHQRWLLLTSIRRWLGKPCTFLWFLSWWWWWWLTGQLVTDRCALPIGRCIATNLCDVVIQIIL